MKEIERLKLRIQEEENNLIQLQAKLSEIGNEHNEAADVGRFGLRWWVEVGLFVFIIWIVYEVSEGHWFTWVLTGILILVLLNTIGYNNIAKETLNEYTKLEKSIWRINNKIKKLEKEYNLEKKRQLKFLINDLMNDLDTDGDGTIDIIQHDNEFMKLVKSNQKLILEMDKSESKDFSRQFIKLSNFLMDKEKNLQKVFQRFSDIEDLDLFDDFKSNLMDQIQFYNVLRLTSLQMISSFVDDDRLTFYLVYEKFDKLGVWNTNFENQFLFKMDVLNSNIELLISEIRDMNDSINYSINELISITNENTFSISEKLGKIGSKLDVGNMLNTINTYQNYQSNKRLR